MSSFARLPVFLFFSPFLRTAGKPMTEKREETGERQK